MEEDTRNVIDRYKNWSIDLIKDQLKKDCFPYIVCMENIIGDFNMGTVIRNANAFGASKVYFIGKRKWDRRGAVGSYHYTDFIHISTVEELLLLKEEGYSFIGLDNVKNSVPMEKFSWPRKTLMIFGEEGNGITPEVLSVCDHIVAITQYGSVRSLNAGTASGIAMFDYTNKF